MGSVGEQAGEPLLTVLIPVKDEAESILGLALEIDRAFEGAGIAWEALWVDDGSSDGSAEILRRLPAPHRYARLDANHGQSAALAAGARLARGAWIGTLDGDGQNVPADLLRQLAYAREHGVDLVGGIRARRQDSRLRRSCSRIANGVRNRLTGSAVTDVGCSTRVARREVFLELPFFHGMHRFLPTLATMRGFDIAEIPVPHRARAAGRSKYGIQNRLWAGLRDLFGVRWLLSRRRVWRVVETGGPGAGEARP